MDEAEGDYDWFEGAPFKLIDDSRAHDVNMVRASSDEPATSRAANSSQRAS